MDDTPNFFGWFDSEPSYTDEAPIPFEKISIPQMEDEYNDMYESYPRESRDYILVKMVLDAFEGCDWDYNDRKQTLTVSGVECYVPEGTFFESRIDLMYNFIAIKEHIEQKLS